jgi:hypothetical protein
MVPRCAVASPSLNQVGQYVDGKAIGEQSPFGVAAGTTGD